MLRKGLAVLLLPPRNAALPVPYLRDKHLLKKCPVSALRVQLLGVSDGCLTCEVITLVSVVLCLCI